MTLTRRIILALALMAGLAPAMAQIPPPVPALPDTERRTSYSITSSTCACSVGFALYGDSTDYGNWLEVFVNEVLIPSANYTITSPTGSLATIARPITDAVLTFSVAQTGTVQIVGARRPRRTTQFNEGGGVPTRNFNVVLSDITAMLRENWDKINDVSGRGVFAPPGETLKLLPILANRMNQGVCFDGGGNLTTCVSVPSSTFAAGAGIAFTGVGPTSISLNVALPATTQCLHFSSAGILSTTGFDCSFIIPTPVTAASLQAAITAACAGGATVLQMPAGTWTIDTTASPINVTCGLIIQGVGGSVVPAAGTLLQNTAAANDLFNVTTNGTVIFRDFAVSTTVTKNAATALFRLNNSTTGISQQVIGPNIVTFGGCNVVEVDNSFHFIIKDNLFTSFTCAGIVITQPATSDEGNNLIEGNKLWDISGTAGADSCILWHRGSGVRVIGNRCLGAFNYGLHIQFDNTVGDDGALTAIGNTFEVQKLSGIYLERTTAAQTAGTTIGQMVFSNNFIQTITTGNTGSINIAQSGVTPWVQGCVIMANSIQVNQPPAFNGAIEIDGADQCNIADNMLYVVGGIGAGIRVSGVSTNTKVVNNSNDGTNASAKYPALNSTTTVVDNKGNIFANLPSAAANGSQMYVGDGTPASSPCTGSGGGSMAFRQNNAWKCF